MIAILLSTYNSVKYLRAQVDSILAQTLQEWTLYIRDDGSVDGTLAIIEEYCAQHQNIVLLPPDGDSLGARDSFARLLERIDAPYYMFCDHDDVWLPFKIARTFEKMQAVERQYPDMAVLIHTDATVTDENLAPLSDSLWRFSRANPEVLRQCDYLCASNGVTGCTVMINHRAKDVSLPILPQAIMHDWWVALCVSKSGVVDYIDTPTLLYRQHDKNTLGAPTYAHHYLLHKAATLLEVLSRNIKNYRMVKLVNNMSIFRYTYLKATYHVKRQQHLTR
jgi:glycosyltransferase involved in cell wall biosynthesis